MATKTLSVDEEAYRKLVRAREHRRESFSQVIKRATWNAGQKRCGDLLHNVTGIPSEETLAYLERAQLEDSKPEDKWAR
ncbi:MAG: antitoxin VapB family protein [Verrucomicrobiota bacterium]